MVHRKQEVSYFHLFLKTDSFFEKRQKSRTVNVGGLFFIEMILLTKYSLAMTGPVPASPPLRPRFGERDVFKPSVPALRPGALPPGSAQRSCEMRRRMGDKMQGRG